MKKYTYTALLFFYSTALFAQTSGPLTPPEGNKNGFITMVICFVVVFLISLALYKKKGKSAQGK